MSHPANAAQNPAMHPQLAERIRREAEENDVIYRGRSLDSLDLGHLHYGHKEMLDWVLGQMPKLQGARVLDIGIGEGQSCVLLARAGAQVTGIDVSAGALERAAELARRYEVKAEFQQMPGEELRFADATFDAILCMSAYHHMDLEQAARGFARVLRPGGRLVMIDPLATNPPAWLYRQAGRWLQREATSEETPLRVRDLQYLRRYFRRVAWHGMYFTSVLPFGVDRLCKTPNRVVHATTRAMFRCTSPLDRALLRLPGLGRMAWKIAVVADL
ncbi:MAG: methyltransferase domain-containing protein [Acidobacteria bacterium]|nr:methyltransferase domain-containing protein [Acidobacteriota bacterium]